MTGSFLSAFDLNKTITELQMSEAKCLIHNSRALHAEYRRNAELVKCVYDLAWEVLKYTLGEKNISLPIDVRRVADVLGFVVSSDDFSSVELDYILSDHDCLPVAQLKMRRKLFGKEGESICGTIRVAKNLNENSTRFSIAHELGHVVLRHQNPIGSSVVREACPGMYPLVDTDEMMADMFAQALLLPYQLFQTKRDEYERDRTHWPLDFSTWIAYIRDKAQIPEYHAVIACQEIKKRDIIERIGQAEDLFQKWILSISGNILELENVCSAVKSLYARTVFNLEGWGYSSEQVADILFGTWSKYGGTKDSQIRRDFVSILHDYWLETVITDDGEPKQNSDLSLPPPVLQHIFNSLYDVGLSKVGIGKVTGLEDYMDSAQKSAAEYPSEDTQDVQNKTPDSEDNVTGTEPVSDQPI